MSETIATRERVVGLEMEYSPSIRYFNDDGKPSGVVNAPNPDHILGILHHTYTAVGRGFLGNSYRSYIDGMTAEIGTPESYPHTVGVCQRASEEMILDSMNLIIDANLKSSPEGQRALSILPLRVSDGKVTSGYHENYQAFLCNDDATRLLTFIGGHAAAQTIWTGQGEYNRRANRFQIAQKLSVSNRGSHDVVQIKSRDIPNHMRYEFRRTNYPVTDWQLRHRMAFTSAVIRFAELGLYRNKDIVVGGLDSITAKISATPYAKLELLNGTYKTAAEYEMWLAEQILKEGGRRGFPSYELEAAKKVYAVCADISIGELDQVQYQVPWIMKKKILLHKLPELFDQGYTPNERNRKLARAMCVACDMRGVGGFVDVIRARTEAASYSTVEIQKAKTDPDCLPFAKARARAIKHLNVNRKTHYQFNYAAHWMHPSITRISS